MNPEPNSITDDFLSEFQDPLLTPDQEREKQKQEAAKTQPPVPEEPPTKPKEVEEESSALNNVAEAVAAIPISGIDFGMDVVGMVPGLGGLDDAYDEYTKFKNPYIQKFREVSSIILPSMFGTGLVLNGVTKLGKISTITKALASLGGVAAVDAGVTYVSDTSEEGDNLLRGLDDLTGGSLNIPNNWMTLDSDSPEVRRQKMTYEAVGLSILGDLLGYGINLGKVLKGGKMPQFMDWFKPTDDAAKTYKASKVVEAPDVRVGEAPVESHVRNQSIRRDIQVDELGVRQLEIEYDNPGLAKGYNEYITSKNAPAASKAVFTTEPAAPVRNAVEVSARKQGITDGPAANVLSEPEYKFIAKTGSARKFLDRKVREIQSAGKFQWLINNFRGSSRNLDDDALDFYAVALGAEDMKDLKEAFLSRRATMPLSNQPGDVIEYATEQQTRGAFQALRDLTNIYLGKPIAAQSGRALDSAANEITLLASGAVKFSEVADFKHVQEMILDRMQFLLQEVGLNKYISGWQLQNKKLAKKLDKMAPTDDANELVNKLRAEFDEATVKNIAKSKETTNTIAQLMDSDRELAQTFVDAFAMSRGDITTIDGMMKWANSQGSLRSLIVSPKGGVSMLAQGLWAVRYNNVLSGLSALRAGLGNTTNLLLKSNTAVLGHGLEGLATGDFKNFHRARYAYASMAETNRRALTEAWGAWKRVNDDPTAFMDLMRKDRNIIRDDQQWNLMQRIADTVWKPNGDTGKLVTWEFLKLNRNASQLSFMRWGTNAMIAADQYANVSLATHKSRMMAYDEVFQQIGHMPNGNKELLAAAEKKHYANMFDKNGLIKDAAVKHSAGELALNLDAPVSDFISNATNQFPVLKSFFMFPRTGVNAVKLGASYLPIAAIPGTGKIADTLLAKTDDEIAAALAKHGIKESDPDRMLIFENLKAEYKGRMAMGGMITAAAFAYAMGGNIHGNGPVNAGERKKLRDNGFFFPKTIKIGNKRISYAGVEPFDTLLSLIGDATYYASDIGSSVFEDIQTKIAWTFTASFTDKTFLSGIEPFIKLTTGDGTAIQRFLANETRAYIPMSGAAGVLASAVSSSQKDIYNDMVGYIKNRLPGFNTQLPERIDIWTGKPINDISNPFMRILNAANPVPISDGGEPWRQWLFRTGWDGMRLLRKDSTGKYEYTPAEREQLYRIMGRMGLDKEIQKLMKSEKLNAELDRMRQYRAQNVNYSYMDLRTENLDTHRILNKIIRRAQKKAELIMESKNPTMANKIEAVSKIQRLMKAGELKDAKKHADFYQIQFDQIEE
jgi:hypothetical protein